MEREPGSSSMGKRKIERNLIPTVQMYEGPGYSYIYSHFRISVTLGMDQKNPVCSEKYNGFHCQMGELLEVRLQKYLNSDLGTGCLLLENTSMRILYI